MRRLWWFILGVLRRAKMRVNSLVEMEGQLFAIDKVLSGA